MVVTGRVVALQASTLLVSVDLRLSKVLSGKVRTRKIRVWSIPVSGYPQLSPHEVKPGTSWAMVLEPGHGREIPQGDFLLQACSEGYVRVARSAGEPGIRMTDLERDIRIARAKYSERNQP